VPSLALRLNLPDPQLAYYENLSIEADRDIGRGFESRSRYGLMGNRRSVTHKSESFPC
jgi:hypothetical protein